MTQDKACEFAGIQCQIQFGDYDENKHRPGLLDLKEFLPQSYVKVKGIEKKVFAEHRKHIGLSELEAKVLYTKTARSLTTYGVTFFLVKVRRCSHDCPSWRARQIGVTLVGFLVLQEKIKGKNKTDWCYIGGVSCLAGEDEGEEQDRLVLHWWGFLSCRRR